MHITAIICEYNPLHSGHEYQIAQAKKHCDRLVCIMSASFVQRGEPAFYDKWSRAKWALAAGADMVIELPCIYSLRAAQYFAQGAVAIAGGTGADSLCFGMEDDNLALPESIADFQLQKSPEYTAALRYNLGRGLSYAAAVEAATRLFIDIPQGYFQPNNTLALEYIKAAKGLGLRMAYLPIKRIEGISSSACRADIIEASINNADNDTPLPEYVKTDITELQYITLEQMAPMLLYALRMLPQAELTRLPDTSEGLENRIYKAARRQATLDGLLEDISVKRYPLARIKRVLCMAMLGVRREDMRMPTYARVLGMRRDAGDMVDAINARGSLPLVTKAVDLANDPIFAVEQRATDIRALAEKKPAGLDFTRPIVLA